MILVDWSGPGSGPLYNVAKANAEPTGRYIWEMYSYLNSHGLRWKDMHCIGHSLGAHVCGFSGKASSGECEMKENHQNIDHAEQKFALRIEQFSEQLFVASSISLRSDKYFS
jgi:hypothetical protein